jgi:ribosomal-protein-alanine N-acetyltransferase
MKPAIRPMRREDIPNIVYNDRRILGQSLGEETLENELKENAFTRFFVMEDEESGQFLGHIGIWIDIPLASILNLYVVPEHQHHRLGSVLMDFILDYLKNNDVNTLTLEVRKSNDIAMNMYHQYGFEAVAIRRNYYADGEDAFLMLKNIDAEK